MNNAAIKNFNNSLLEIQHEFKIKGGAEILKDLKK